MRKKIISRKARVLVAIPSDSGQVSTSLKEAERKFQKIVSQSLLIQGRFQPFYLVITPDGVVTRVGGSQSLLIQGRFQLEFLLKELSSLEEIGRNPF